MLQLAEIEKSLILKLIGKFGASPKKAVSEALIATELGVDGDDAAEFLAEIEVEFNVGLSDLLHARFWPESGFWFAKGIEPISISELALEIHKRQH